MSLTTGTVSCRSYLVEKIPTGPDFIKRVDTELARHSFRPVRVDRSPRSMGWVNVRDVLDTNLTMDKIQFGNYIVLGLRVDKVAINNKMLRAHFLRKLRDLLKQRQNRKLGREERAALLENTRIELMEAQSPATSLYEMAWGLESGHVYFSTSGNAINDEFADLFHDTFHASITPMFPFLRAQTQAEQEGMMAELLDTEPSSFSPLANVRIIRQQEEA